MDLSTNEDAAKFLKGILNIGRTSNTGIYFRFKTIIKNLHNRAKSLLETLVDLA